MSDKTDDIVEGDPCDVCEGCEDDGWGEDYIMSPLPSDEGGPMVLVSTANRWFIGAFFPTEGEDERGLLLGTPLLMMETMSKDQTQVVLMMSKIFHNLSLQDHIRVKHESLIFLKSKSAMDKRIVAEYEKQIQNYSIKDAGLVAPTVQDIRNIGKA